MWDVKLPLLRKNLTQHIGGTRFILNVKTLNIQGPQVNNALGQVLLAKRMGKRKLSLETRCWSAQCGNCSTAALFNMECTIYMGEEDVKRQALNVFRMELLGAKVETVTGWFARAQDAVNAAPSFMGS